MILFHWCRKINIYILKTLSFRVGGGQDKLAWTAYPPGVKIIRVGGKISREILPPGGASCPGGQDKLLHPLYNLKTVRGISMKLGTLIKQNDRICDAQEL